ncbi:hypothetical protein KIW84_030565 [Lathyrus oleraceus]|uniref:Uncharacterized protein n=1 Tax=Pisum sativum TaxID=3888 RepID=A0A9D4XNF8_PEA|nr:hypothetical protein KIW84_030565 [Pisum sativum]
MLSAVIRSALGYPAFTVGTITGTPELTYRFNGRTSQPLEPTTAPGGEEPTSRDGPSTQHRRITKADFRPCSTGGSCSQAFFLWTRGPISVWPEKTFGRLRYLLGGLRPIETVYLRLFLGLSWHKVRILALPEWYLTDGSSPPEGGFLCLPPKLRRKSPKPIPGNSEAS